MRCVSRIITAGLAASATVGLALMLPSAAGTATARAGGLRQGSAAPPAPQGPHIHLNSVQGGGGSRPWVANPIDFYLYNDTPYTWTLDPTQTTNEVGAGSDWTLLNWAGAPPPQTLQPGQVMHLQSFTQSQGDVNVSVDDAWVGYTFIDVNGGGHLVQVNAGGYYYQAPVRGYSLDGSASSGWTNSTSVFHMATQPSAPANSVGGFINNPVSITIDAKTNPDGAAQALSHFADSDPNTRAFTPTAPPTWSQSDAVPGSATLINTTSTDSELVATTGTTNAETTSLSEEMSWETELGILGVVNESLAVSISGGQEWSTSTETKNGDLMGVKPGDKGWFVKTNQVENVTGNFDFTIYNGLLTYHIQNATFSMPGLTHKDAEGVPIPGTAFTPHTEAYHP